MSKEVKFIDPENKEKLKDLLEKAKEKGFKIDEETKENLLKEENESSGWMWIIILLLFWTFPPKEEKTINIYM